MTRTMATNQDLDHRLQRKNAAEKLNVTRIRVILNDSDEVLSIFTDKQRQEMNRLVERCVDLDMKGLPQYKKHFERLDKVVQKVWAANWQYVKAGKMILDYDADTAA